MIKSGLIIGSVALLLGACASLLTPLCVPCMAVFLGLVAGYLGGVFEAPEDSGQSTKSGLTAGAIAGGGVILGQIVGAIANALLMGPEGAANFVQQLGLPISPGFESSYWGGTVGLTCCLGFFDILLTAGLGALGGLFWWQFTGKNRADSQFV